MTPFGVRKPLYFFRKEGRALTLYVDIFLCYNALADYLLLHLTAAFAGIPARRRPILLAASLGTVYALAAAVWQGALLWPPVKVGISLLMVRLAFGRGPLFLRRWLFFLIVSSAFSGFTVMLKHFTSSDVIGFSLLIFPAASLAAYGVLSVSFCGSAEAVLKKEIIKIRIGTGNSGIRLHAFLDSGCQLRDKNGERVLIVQRTYMEPLSCVPQEHIRFESLGGGGELEAFSAPVQIGNRPAQIMTVALAPPEVQFADGYQAILGRE